MGTENAVNKEINKGLKNNKSAGHDNVPVELIKHITTETQHYKLKEYNHMRLNKIFSDKWRKVVIIHILKPNCDKIHPTNYRPIALSNILDFNFFLEKIAYKRITLYLENINIITKYECGFRKNRTTTTHIIT